MVKNSFIYVRYVAGNLLSTLMSSYDDDISDDGASDEQRVAEPSAVELDWFTGAWLFHIIYTTASV